MSSGDHLHPLGAGGLAALVARVREDLEFLNYPPANWVPPTPPVAGTPVSDVVIVGGGMCGNAAAFALRRRGVSNIRILDRAPSGREGPWLGYARMTELRSPKQLTGPVLGMASLTFRAWFTATHGREAWDRLDKIPRLMWMDYLSWYRRVLDVPVENGIEVTRLSPHGELWRLELSGAPEPFLLARKVVLATGRDGIGKPYVPAFLASLSRGGAWAHTADAIAFENLRAKRVVVVGMGASAMDNAAEALEHGAREVRLLARRTQMPRINKMMGAGHPGFIDGFPELDPQARWRIMHYAASEQTPAPHGSTLRVSRHANAFFHFGCAIAKVSPAGSGLQIETRTGRMFDTDFLIAATGFTVDPQHRPELAAICDQIAVWGDRVSPPAGFESTEIARFPYLGRKFEFTERRPGSAPWLANLHCFNYAASLSLGKTSGDIPAVSQGAMRLAQGIAADLYKADFAEHWRRLEAYDKPELQGDEWRDADA